MYYSAPVIKKGMIRNPHCMNPGHSQYSGAHYDGLFSCGNIWAPPDARLAKCPEMKQQYRRYLSNRQRLHSKTNWPYCGKKGKTYRTAMADAERKGKDAWKLCKVGKREEQNAAEEMDMQLSLAPGTLMTPSYMQAGSTMSQPGAGGQMPIPGVDYPVDTGTGTGDTGSTAEEIEEANRKLMMYGGIAAGGLLLLLLLRR